MSSRLGKSTEQVHALTVYACHTHEYPLYSRETTSFTSIIIQHIQVHQVWVPYDWEAHAGPHRRGDPLGRDRNSAACQPASETMLEWTVDQNEQYCRENHNACFLTVTNRPYYALLSCKNIAKGKTMQPYYGPASGFLLGQYVNKKFLCWITEFIEGTSNISVYCQLLT